ncbi:MAG: hypothetical protein JXA43_02690, partial [Candidatus Diapherotrites archaeon]|nr:hypothetical protein [Candidatus Diapherotrites archaeon]
MAESKLLADSVRTFQLATDAAIETGKKTLGFKVGDPFENEPPNAIHGFSFSARDFAEKPVKEDVLISQDTLPGLSRSEDEIQNFYKNVFRRVEEEKLIQLEEKEIEEDSMLDMWDDDLEDEEEIDTSKLDPLDILTGSPFDIPSGAYMGMPDFVMELVEDIEAETPEPILTLEDLIDQEEEVESELKFLILERNHLERKLNRIGSQNEAGEDAETLDKDEVEMLVHIEDLEKHLKELKFERDLMIRKMNLDFVGIDAEFIEADENVLEDTLDEPEIPEEHESEEEFEQRLLMAEELACPHCEEEFTVGDVDPDYLDCPYCGKLLDRE